MEWNIETNKEGIMNFKLTTLRVINEYFELELKHDTCEEVELYDDRWIAIDGENWHKLPEKNFDEFYKSL